MLSQALTNTPMWVCVFLASSTHLQVCATRYSQWEVSLLAFQLNGPFHALTLKQKLINLQFHQSALQATPVHKSVTSESSRDLSCVVQGTSSASFSLHITACFPTLFSHFVLFKAMYVHRQSSRQNGGHKTASSVWIMHPQKVRGEKVGGKTPHCTYRENTITDGTVLFILSFFFFFFSTKWNTPTTDFLRQAAFDSLSCHTHTHTQMHARTR